MPRQAYARNLPAPRLTPFAALGVLPVGTKYEVVLTRYVAVICLALFLISGCKSTPAPADALMAPAPALSPTTNPASDPDRIVAKVNGRPIRIAQLEKPLIDAYGLNVLLNLVQLELAKQQANQSAVTVTDADIAHERELTLEKMFADAAKDDWETLLDQFLNQQRISRPEFDLVVQTNTYLRKIAEPMLAGKLTEENLKEGFAAIYGETIEVRDIQVANLQEIAEVRRRLAAGEPFEKVAREMSSDARTAPLGGALPPFSRQMAGVSDAFKEAAFALKVGETSDPVQAGDGYHLIKLMKRNPPKAVKYEDLKESVRKQLQDRWVTQTMKDLRTALAQQGMQTLEIEEPVLKKQFDKKMGVGQAAAQDRQRIDRELERDRQRIRQQQEFHDPATAPTTKPTTNLTPKKSAEPPATKPGH